MIIQQSSGSSVIVGGGIYGTATAWALANRGRDVLLLERGTIASGASGGAGRRGVRANGRDLRELPLIAIAYDEWSALEGRLGHEIGYVRSGQLRLYERHHDRGEAETRAQVQSRNGVPTVHLNRAELLEIEPGLGPDVIGGLHCPSDGMVDHTSTTLAFAQAARELGAKIVEHAPVTQLVRTGARISHVVLEDGSDIPVVGDLLLLANAGVPDLVERTSGIHLPVWTVWPQVVMTAPIEPCPLATLIGHAHRPLALKPTVEGGVMMSGGWRGRWDAEAARGVTLSSSVTGNIAQAVAVFPALADAQITEAHADRPETISFDGIPIIDRLPGLENALIATGWSGHGWAVAPAVAPLLATWVETGSAPELLHPFAMGRFG